MKKLTIRNSTIQFLVFVSEQGGNTVDIAFQDGDLWATEKVMAMLYGIDRSGIARHIKNIFTDGELDENMVCAFFAHTTQHGAIEGKTQTQEVKFYNLDLAEDRAKKGIPMTMLDWANRLDKFLLADDRDLLQNAGTISAKIAKDKAESEFEKYRLKQDQIYTSDFDRFMLLEKNIK